MKKKRISVLLFLALVFLSIVIVRYGCFSNYPDYIYSGDFMGISSAKVPYDSKQLIIGDAGLYTLYPKYAFNALVAEDTECLSLNVEKASTTSSGIAYINSKGHLIDYSDRKYKVADNADDLCWNGNGIIFLRQHDQSIYLYRNKRIEKLFQFSGYKNYEHLIANESYVVLVDDNMDIVYFEIGANSFETINRANSSNYGVFYLIDEYLIMVGENPLGGKVYNLAQNTEFELNLGWCGGFEMDTISAAFLDGETLYLSVYSKPYDDLFSAAIPYAATLRISTKTWEIEKINNCFYPILYQDTSEIWGLKSINPTQVELVSATE